MNTFNLQKFMAAKENTGTTEKQLDSTRSGAVPADLTEQQLKDYRVESDKTALTEKQLNKVRK